jgi:hypothetical protein
MSEEQDVRGPEAVRMARMRARGHPGRRLLVVVLAAAALGVAAGLPACDAGHTPGSGGPSARSTLLRPDAGWVAAGGAEFQPAPFKYAVAQRTGGSTLVAATGSQARVKWIADRAGMAGSQDARSRISLRVVDVTDPSARADVAFRGAGGAGSADLPIEAGKRSVYRLTWTAVGTYRRCSVLIEVRTQ